jgi:hypothetical protein
MAEEIEWFVGIDWASQSHQVCLIDAHGECLGADSGRSRPRIRDDFAHQSDLMSLGVPR